MKYIDDIFTDMMKSVDEQQISHRDLKIFKSLAKSISGTAFITVNQGRLLLRLLRENNSVFSIDPDVLQNPVWSKSFRPIDDTRKVYLAPRDDTYLITIEFAYSATLRKTIQEKFRNNEIEGLIADANSKKYLAALTEKNIVLIVDTLYPLGFTIDETLLEYCDIIKTWNITDIKDQYRINTLSHANFQKQLTADLGIDTPLTQNIIADRSIRYQYFVDKKTPTTLTEIIAYREQAKLWVDSNVYSLHNVIESLIELKRLPVLLVFDTYNQKDLSSQLIEISNTLEYFDINDVGIYFRLPNNDVGKDFNAIIADQKYNAVLDNSTRVVGVETNKIPKFILKTNWKPMSVVCVNTSLRNSKTAVYTNCCDLIITYDKETPLISYIKQHGKINN